MIDLSVLPLFFTTIFFLAISPGPDLLLLSSYSSSKGFMAGVMVSIGVLLAGVVQTSLVAFGLGELMMAMPIIALGVKLVGAAYLTYIGLKMLLTWYKSVANHEQNQALQSDDEMSFKTIKISSFSLINKGLLNNLLNPKALLFFSLFLPQFTHDGSDLTIQILILGLILSLFVFLINLAFSFTFSQLGRFLGKKLTLGQHIDGILGVIFLGLAARLATSK
ncbi:amino acid transporter [Marinomonas sp. S3726]|uniref:LysE family translocator n=1 Tax=Marinomonas sp. S3726 TaxID=579484 RepID=UPI0005F9F8FC|nr:LysE family translocator [Marinomonas sp. S3726]KJZ10940.1 amino acid transporter [Marinomonas sp. S3726]